MSLLPLRPTPAPSTFSKPASTPNPRPTPGPLFRRQPPPCHRDRRARHRRHPPSANAAADPTTVLVLGYVDLASVPDQSCLFTTGSPAPVAHADGAAVVAIGRGTPAAPWCARMASCTRRGDIASRTKMQWTVSLPLATPLVAPRRRQRHDRRTGVGGRPPRSMSRQQGGRPRPQAPWCTARAACRSWFSRVGSRMPLCGVCLGGVLFLHKGRNCTG